jgi:hypothetical protein
MSKKEFGNVWPIESEGRRGLATYGEALMATCKFCGAEGLYWYQEPLSERWVLLSNETDQRTAVSMAKGTVTNNSLTLTAAAMTTAMQRGSASTLTTTDAGDGTAT